jgi:hypothetical protein
MTIPIDQMRVSYNGANTTDTFPFTNVLLQDDDDITCIIKNTTTDAETTLTKTTHYTVSNLYVSTGATVALVNGSFDWIDADGDLKTGYRLILLRTPAFTQEASIQNQSAFLPEIHEDAFDRTVMRDQNVRDWLERSIHIPQGEDPDDYPMELPAAASRAGAALGFDADGNLALSNNFDGSSDPSVTSVTITGLTASRLVATDASKVLSSVSLSTYLAGTANKITVTDDGDGTATLTLPDSVTITTGLTISGLTASRLVATDGSKVLTSISDISVWVLGTANQIVSTPSSGTTTLSISSTLVLPGTMAFSSTIAGTGSHTDTSSTKNVVSIAPTFAPASGTANFVGVSIAPVFNRGGGSGRASALSLNATVTSAFTGNMAALTIGTALSGGSDGTRGGIWLYGLDSAATTWEAMRLMWRGGHNAYILSTEHQNGSVREFHIAIGASAGSGGGRYQYSATEFYATDGQDLGTGGEPWRDVYANRTYHSFSGSSKTQVNYAFNSNAAYGFYWHAGGLGMAVSMSGEPCALFGELSFGGTAGVFTGGSVHCFGFLDSALDAATTLRAAFWNKNGDQGVIWQANLGTSQNFFVANETDNNVAAVNAEFGGLFWGGDVLHVGTQKMGTGTARNLSLATDATSRWVVSGTTGHIQGATANTYDIVNIRSVTLGTTLTLGDGGTTGWVASVTAATGLTAKANARFSHGTSALATSATEGFLHVQSCNGNPAGTPASIPTGQVPMVIDSATPRVYFYIGGTWRYAALT